MKFMITALFSLLSCFVLVAQNTCEQGFITDSLYNENEGNFMVSTALVTPALSNGDVIKLFRNGKRNFLVIETKSNLYFDMTDDLEINSGTQSMLKKGMKQYERNKYTAFYVLEIYRNYVATLRDLGITSFTFNKTENIYNKQDVKEIRKIAKCYYQTINVAGSN